MLWLHCSIRILCHFSDIMQFSEPYNFPVSVIGINPGIFFLKKRFQKIVLFIRSVDAYAVYT